MSKPFPTRSYAFTEQGDALNWIGGAFVPAIGGGTLAVENPRHGKVMGRVAMSGPADVDAAVKAAIVAQKAWRTVPVRERADIFYKLKVLLQRDLEELAWLVSHENGKTYAEGKASVEKTIECVEFGCSLGNMGAGEQLDVSRGVNCRVDHEPLGVVGGIAPFNFPLMVAMWMLPQALVGGNAFIMKPSELVPFCSGRLALLFKEAGLPDGLFNVINGGADAVNAIADHPDIKAVAFVGSTRVGKMVYARGAATGKTMLCLGGAKNHLMIAPDADRALTAPNVVASFTGCAGQRCMAASVLLAVGNVDAILTDIIAGAKKVRLGEDMGAIINQAAMDRINGYINDAEKRGAKVVVDGRNAVGPDGGYWIGPTILDHCTMDMPCTTEEIFGPVISIVRVKTLDEALAIENANPYGNAACIYTSSGAVANYVTSRVEAGMVGVNVGVPVPREPFGFGGWNLSKFGAGNITGYDGWRFWTRPRKVTTKWAVQTDTTWMG
jgi:malonate-semialdehyde dehydrogenase (acetylating)/methylmalonate-semialdehyde dehydrogenase